jgi:hypothetical protein
LGESRASLKLRSASLHYKGLTLARKATNFLSTLISLKMAEYSEAKSAKRSWASKIKIFLASLRSAIFSGIKVYN